MLARNIPVSTSIYSLALVWSIGQGQESCVAPWSGTRERVRAHVRALSHKACQSTRPRSLLLVLSSTLGRLHGTCQALIWSKGVSLILVFRKMDFFEALQWFLVLFLNLGFWSLQTTLLCIVGELAGQGGPVAVAVCVSDRWQVTWDPWHLTHDTWNVTCDRWFNFLINFYYDIGATNRTRQEIYMCDFYIS